MLKGLRGITSKIPYKNGLHTVHAVLPPEELSYGYLSKSIMSSGFSLIGISTRDTSNLQPLDI